MNPLFWTIALLPVSPETFTIHPVPGAGDFVSPAEALTSPLVLDGDVLEVHPGTYAGTLLVDKAVELVAVGSAAHTVLDGGGTGPVVEVAAGAALRGFTITGAGGPVSYGGVKITSTSTVHLVRNVIAGNHPDGDDEIPCGGVTVVSGASAVLEGNDIHSNTSWSVGGVLAGGTSSVDLIANRIRGNGGGPTITGGILYGASGRLVNNQITGNYGSGTGGLYVAGGMGPAPFGASIEIVNCTIYGNKGFAPIGSVGGVLFDDGGAVTIRNTLIHSNFGATGMDTFVTPDFAPPPSAGFVDLDWSHVGMTSLPSGPHMVPGPLAPLLVAPTVAMFGPVALGDFRPARPSPELDAGASAAFPADLALTDLDGKARVQGLAIDVGAFERGRLRSRGF